MKYDFDKYEYTIPIGKTGVRIVVAQSPDPKAKRLHLYLHEYVTHESLGWFRSEEAAAKFLDALAEG